MNVPQDQFGRALATAFSRSVGPKINEEMVANALMARSELMSTLLDPRRDVDAECHYPSTQEVTPEQYKQLFDRDPIACRVVNCLPSECWQVQPSVFETDDPNVTTPFEEAWDLLQPMTSGFSWYKSEEGSSVWDYLRRADILSGIGHFGVLLMGFDDGKNLQEPVEGAMVTNAFCPTGLDSIKGKFGKASSYRVKKLPPIENRKQFIPDCYLTKNEEDNLRKLPNLTEQEEFTLNCLAKQREVIVNAMQREKSLKGKQVTNLSQLSEQMSLSGNTRDEHDPPTAEGVQGTDRQYSQEFGLMGEAQYKPGGRGVDQQYFGVQFGPSERPSDRPPSRKKLNLLFLRSFDESLVQIVRYEWNINNPRFGMPVMYRITLNDPREQHSGIGLPMATVFVHWSRVIHIADNLNSSEIFGAPRMRPVLNRLLDLQKIYGSSAEGYWQAAFTGIALETHPQLGGDVEVDTADTRRQLENYVNSLQRYLALTGMSAHTLAPQVSDPSNHIEKHLEAICIQLAIPMRVFRGAERGELASSQDDADFNDVIQGRQNTYITPRIIAPFIDRLIAVGVLPEPNYVPPVEPELDEDGNPVEEYDEDGNLLGGDTESDVEEEEKQYDEDGNLIENAFCPTAGPIFNADGDQVGVRTKTGYSVVWPDLDSNTELGKARIAATKTQALATFVGGNVEAVMPLMEFYTKILSMSEEEAKPLVKAVEEQQMMAQQQQMDQQMMGMPMEGGQMAMGDVPEQEGFEDQLQQNAFCPTPEEIRETFVNRNRCINAR